VGSRSLTPIAGGVLSSSALLVLLLLLFLSGRGAQKKTEHEQEHEHEQGRPEHSKHWGQTRVQGPD